MAKKQSKKSCSYISATYGVRRNCRWEKFRTSWRARNLEHTSKVKHLDMIHTFVCDESNGLRQNLNSSILNTDWCSIEHSDMSVPMLCGIAAALRVHQVRTTMPRKDYTECKLHLLWRHVTGRLDTPEIEDKKSWTKKVDKLEEQEAIIISQIINKACNVAKRITIITFFQRLLYRLFHQI